MIVKLVRWSWLWGIGYGLWLCMAMMYVWPDYITYRRLQAGCFQGRQRLASVTAIPARTASVSHWTLSSDTVVQQRFLKVFNALVQQQALTLIALQHDGLTCDATLIGHFVSLLNLLQTLNLQSFGVWITQVSLQVSTNEQLQLSLRLKLLPIQWASSSLPLSTAQHLYAQTPLFCTQSAKEMQRHWPIRWMSVSQMRMVGYIADGKQQQALLLLADNSILPVQPGTVLGKEKAVVTVIEPERVMVRSPEAPHATWTLTLRP